MTVGLGVLTYNRPDAFGAVMDAVIDHLLPVVSHVVTYNDGSSVDYGEPLEQIAATNRALEDLDEQPGCHYIWTCGSAENRGVAHGKNRLLSALLDYGCEWIFLLEDDVAPLGPEAIEGYLAAARHSGYGHLSFHGHGGLNTVAIADDGVVCFWPHYVGAFCLYSREALAAGGLFDEGFRNAYEHLEHTLRLAKLGFTSPWRRAADASGSEHWLKELSVDSVIRSEPGWKAHSDEAREYWRRAHPETYRSVFPT